MALCPKCGKVVMCEEDVRTGRKKYFEFAAEVKVHACAGTLVAR